MRIDNVKRCSALPRQERLAPQFQPGAPDAFIAAITAAAVIVQSFGGNRLDIAGDVRGSAVEVIAGVVGVHHQPAQRSQHLGAALHRLGGDIANRDVPVGGSKLVKRADVVGVQAGQVGQFDQQ